MMKPNPKANSGVVKRGFDASINKIRGNSSSSNTEPISNSKKKPDDSTDQHQSNETDSGSNDSPNEKIKHDSSLNNDNSIVTKNGERVKKYHLKLLLLLISKKHHIH